ncbi:MAG: polyphenol oxidase family protein [Actinomycetota bacterium]
MQPRPLGEASVLVSALLQEIGVFGAFTERSGGDSPAPFASLNMSYSVGDDAALVRGNRLRVIEGLDIPPFAVGGLIHGATITRIGPKRAGAGFDDPQQNVPDADGLATASIGVPMAVTTADCVPLIYASSAEPTVAIVHAGWRGFAAGIVTAGLAMFDDPGRAVVAIGPAIGPCHYEVGTDVALAVAAASQVGAVTERHGDVLRLDLVGTARAMLEAEGVGRVEVAGVCTGCEADRFFSHRRDGITGRHAAIAMRSAR